MQIAIIQFPGSNCERETILAVKRAGMTPVEFLWNEPHEKLLGCDGFIIVGGFSYEDRSRAGVIAALDPIMQLIKSQNELGKPVLGICNGAQILVETGMVPGLKNYTVDVALTDNKRVQSNKVLGTGYYNTWVHIKRSTHHQPNAFTRHFTENTRLHIPIAHAEGRFVISEDLLTEIKSQGLAILQYCDEEGNVVDEFPVNPNGSIHNIAALTNKAGNVLAIMPHPERTTNGDLLFHSMRDYIASGIKSSFSPLDYRPKQSVVHAYKKPAKTTTLAIELIITDNQAMSVENALRHHGVAVSIKRHVHWEIHCDQDEILHQIQTSGLLFNDRKEFIATIENHPKQRSFLVHAKEDLLGLQKMQQLKQHFSIDGVTIRHGILWHLRADGADLETVAQHVLNTHILFNPSSHECYKYA